MGKILDPNREGPDASAKPGKGGALPPCGPFYMLTPGIIHGRSSIARRKGRHAREQRREAKYRGSGPEGSVPFWLRILSALCVRRLRPEAFVQQQPGQLLTNAYLHSLDRSRDSSRSFDRWWCRPITVKASSQGFSDGSVTIRTMAVEAGTELLKAWPSLFPIFFPLAIVLRRGRRTAVKMVKRLFTMTKEVAGAPALH
jgi:hypothetical protein